MTKLINTAVVGFGMSGEYFHAPFIDADKNFKLVKVVERHSERSKILYPNVEVVRDFENLLEDKNIDLVIVASPNSFHYEMGKKALLAGKHVVIEKPFTRSSAQAEELIEIAAKNKLVLSPYQNRRWDGDFLTVKKIIESKTLGELVEYRSHFDRFRNFIKPNTWKEEGLPDSGLLYDIGPHLIDQALVLFGRPDSVYADLRILREGGKIIDNFEIILNFGKVKAILNSGFLYRRALVRFALSGTHGTYIKHGLDPQEDTLKLNGYSQSAEWGKEPESMWGEMSAEVNGINFSGKIETFAGCYQKYYSNIAEAIRGEEELAVKPEEALMTAKVIEHALESSKKKCALEFKI